MVKLTTRKDLALKGLVVTLHKSNLEKSKICITLKFKTMKHIYRNILLLVMMGAALVGCGKKVENPKPSVSFVSEEGFTTGENHLFTESTLKFGFNAQSNIETAKTLTKFRMFISNGRDVIYDTVFNLNNETSFHCEGEFTFKNLGNWQIIGRAYDAADEQGSAYINIHVQEDMETSFSWKKVGYGMGEIEGFDDYGLLWNDSIVMDTVVVAADTVQLQPADTLITLYLFDASTWNSIESQADKEALFKDIKKTPNNYKNNKIKTYKNILSKKEMVTYNDVLVVLNDNEGGQNYLLYINDSFSEEYFGERHLTVNGKLK